jgi:hypothetical protein
MHCGLWSSGRHAWSHWRRAPLGTREWSTVGRRRVGKKRINFSVGIAWFGDILNISRFRNYGQEGVRGMMD